jgi:nucleoside-diphosphate-sugar epimerase
MSSAIADARILVTGASGFVGGHVARRLSGLGAKLRILARPTSRLTGLAGITFERCDGDLTDPISLARAADGVDFVFHSGGLTSAPNDETYIAVNGEGTKNVCAAAKSAAPSLRRLVYISSMAAAGPAPEGSLIDEELPPRPITPYGASKRLGEKWVQQFDVPWTIIRPPAVYGPEDEAILPLFRMAAWHLKAVVGKGGIASVVYVDNLVDGLVQAATRPEAVGQLFYVADAEPLSRAELARIMQEAVGTWAVPVTVPAWVVRSAARLSEAFAKGFGKVAFFDRHKAADLLTLNWGCRIDHARRFLGYVPRVPTPEGMARTAAWYRQEGWL